jgi:branched-chain amino acid transport system ATP-binding protein
MHPVAAAGSAPLLLEARGVDAGYGVSQVLFGIDLVLARGQVATLLGRNGMGKSTTVKSLLGVVPLRAGRVSFDGAPLAGMRPDAIARRGIAVVPEGRRVFPNLTVHEHLVAFATPRAGSADKASRSAMRPGTADAWRSAVDPMPDAPQAAWRWDADAVYAMFPRLAERRRHSGRQLSGGEQQMLAIGRALTTQPRLLILDEATEGLAPLVRDEIWACLGRLKTAGQTLLVIDKWLDRLLDIGDAHTILERGRVVWSGTSAQFRADGSLAARHLGV